jgi:hypothetical protein
LSRTPQSSQFFSHSRARTIHSFPPLRTHHLERAAVFWQIDIVSFGHPYFLSRSPTNRMEPTRAVGLRLFFLAVMVLDLLRVAHAER